MSARIARPVLLNQIVSPYGISLISTVIFLLAWLFPPELYTRLIYEPDLMFLSLETLLFFFLCIAGFWAGLFLIDFLFPSRALMESSSRPSQLEGLALLLPLIITTAMTIAAVIQRLHNSPDLLTLLLQQEGESIKAQQETTYGPLGWASIMQIAVLWWTWWRIQNSSSGSLRRLISWTVFFVGLVAQVALTLVKVSRSDLIPVLTGLAVLYMLCQIRSGKLRTAGLFRSMFLFMFGAMVLFYLFGILRGALDPTAGFSSFLGYTIASYNRLAALVAGTMHYPYGGHGVYLSYFLDYNHSVELILHLKSTFGWPEFPDLWFSEFQAPEAAGLRFELIWSGAFGYLFSDFGWATPLILSVYGVLYGLVWRSMKSETTLGLCLYPWFAFNALCWFSWNSLFDSRFPFFLAAGLLLMGYEKLLSATFLGSFHSLKLRHNRRVL